MVERHGIRRQAGDLGAVALPYAERGDPGGLPLVLLHAYADSRRSFERVLDHVPPGFRALAPDQRGHGAAPKPPTGYAAADFAADLGLFIDDRGIDAAVLVASSSAGFTTRIFAAERPERVAGLVFIGSPATLRGKPGVESMRARIAALDDPVDPAFVRDFVRGTSGAAVPPGFLEAMVVESLAVPAHVWRLALDGLLEARPPEQLPGPALLIWGEDDAVLDRADQDALAATFADAQILAYPATGHMAHWEQPERVARDVTAFAARVAKP